MGPTRRIFILTIAGLMSATLSASGSAVGKGKTLNAKTPSGLSFLHVPSKKVKRSVVIISWPTDLSQIPAGKEATALLATQLMMKGGAGGRKAGQLAEEIRDLSVRWHLMAKPGSVRLIFDAPNDTQIEGARLINRMLAMPSFNRKRFERIRSEIIAGIDGLETSNLRLAQLAANYFLMGDSRYLRATNTYPSSVVSSVQRADVIAWHKRLFSRRDATIVTAGSEDIKSIGLAIDQILAGLPEKSVPIVKPSIVRQTNPRSKTIVLHNPKARKSTVFIVGKMSGDASTEGYKALNKYAFSLNILSRGSNSRLFNKLRTELGLVYSIRSRYINPTNHERLWALSVDFEQKDLKMGVEAIRNAYSKFRSLGVRKQEFPGLRKLLLRRVNTLMEQPGFLAQRTHRARLRDLRPGNIHKLPLLAANLTSAELNLFIAKKFPPVDNLTTIIVTSRPTIVVGDCFINTPKDASAC